MLWGPTEGKVKLLFSAMIQLIIIRISFLVNSEKDKNYDKICAGAKHNPAARSPADLC